VTENLYITNYSDKRCSPLSSITRLSVEEAYSLAKKFSRYTSTSFTSFSRFNDTDFDGYYKKRVRTEEWLYNSFVELGGKPENPQPLYFVLGESRYLNDWFENGIKTKILLKDIDPAHISFTFGDSMSKMDSPDRMNVFNKESLLNFILKATEDVTSFLKELDKQNRYIEVQLWNDIYLEEVVRSKLLNS
jgi:REP element-mobilizing transposase RayT